MKAKEPKFIWGIKSAYDISGRPCDLYTLNDFDIWYDPNTKSYHYDIETAYDFRGSESQTKYLRMIFKELTEWMHEKGYSTKCKPQLYDLFSCDRWKYGFETLEELYADFKLKCMGFALMNSKKKEKKQED